LYIIVGLGNPGKEYEKTRHNTGFMVVDKIADKYNIDINNKKHKSLIGTGIIEGERVILVKPQTFMNLSGEAASEVMNFYKEDLAKLIVVFDDIDLPIGTIRIKERGSAGTHNGVKSLVHELRSTEFKRVKVGIGAAKFKSDLIGHVLGKFSDEEVLEIEKSLDKAMNAIIAIVRDGVAKAMNEYN